MSPGRMYQPAGSPAGRQLGWGRGDRRGGHGTGGVAVFPGVAWYVSRYPFFLTETGLQRGAQKFSKNYLFTPGANSRLPKPFGT